MKLKKIISYNNNRQIWRLQISEDNKLLVEERDTEKKEAFFNLIDIATGKVLWKEFQAEEKFWVGVEAIYKDVLVFHKFGKPDMPSHKEIIVHSLLDKSLLWKTSEYEYLFIYNDLIYCLKRGFEKHQYFSLNYLTGALVEELGDDYIRVNEIKLAENKKNNFEGYKYAGDYSFAEDITEDVKKVIDHTLRKYDVEGKTEFMKIYSFILFNFYYKNKTGLLTNRFLLYDESKKKMILDEVLLEDAKAVVPDSFFVKDNYLFLLKGKNSVIIYYFKE